MKKTFVTILSLLAASQISTAFAQEIGITCHEGKKDEFTFTAVYPGFQGWSLVMPRTHEQYNASNARFLGGRNAKNFTVAFDGNRYEFSVLGKEPWVRCEGSKVTVSKPGKPNQYLHCDCDVD